MISKFAVLFAFAFLSTIIFTPSIAAQEKMKPEDIAAKHLEAIGAAESRAPDRSRIVSGSSMMTLRTGGSGQAGGPALIASKDDMIVINASFESPEYPYEKMSFDGKNLLVRQYKPGARSPLGEFFLSYDEIFKEGLIGGSLSASWALLHLDERKAKLKYDGTDKIDGRPVYKLKYVPRKNSDLRIKLYFDAENFRHLRTVYERSIAAQMGAAPGQSISQRETRYTVTESFSDFANVSGLTLPKKYTIEYSVFTRNNPIEIEWAFDLSKFQFNQPIDVEEFRGTN